MQLTKQALKKNSWISKNFGSRRGALLAIWNRILYMSGRYQSYKKVDWSSVDRLVFVCKGNICRSAYSETFARSLGLDAVSCGIETTPGCHANSVAVEIAAQRGHDLSGHRTTSIKSISFRKTDLILAMEPWHLGYLSDVYGDDFVFSLLGLWSKPVNPYLHDPYGSSTLYFEKCFSNIEKSVNEIAGKISKAKLH